MKGLPRDIVLLFSGALLGLVLGMIVGLLLSASDQEEQVPVVVSPSTEPLSW